MKELLLVSDRRVTIFYAPWKNGSDWRSEWPRPGEANLYKDAMLMQQHMITTWDFERANAVKMPGINISKRSC